jgi:hypothetical protein
MGVVITVAKCKIRGIQDKYKNASTRILPVLPHMEIVSILPDDSSSLFLN